MGSQYQALVNNMTLDLQGKNLQEKFRNIQEVQGSKYLQSVT